MPAIVDEATATSGSLKGGEERDRIFGRLFGLFAIIQSEILFRPRSGLKSFEQTLSMLAKLYHSKPWLKESTGWAILTLIRSFVRHREQIAWSHKGLERLYEMLFPLNCDWTPEMIAWMLCIQSADLVCHVFT